MQRESGQSYCIEEETATPREIDGSRIEVEGSERYWIDTSAQYCSGEESATEGTMDAARRVSAILQWRRISHRGDGGRILRLHNESAQYCRSSLHSPTYSYRNPRGIPVFLVGIPVFLVGIPEILQESQSNYASPGTIPGIPQDLHPVGLTGTDQDLPGLTRTDQD